MEELVEEVGKGGCRRVEEEMINVNSTINAAFKVVDAS